MNWSSWHGALSNGFALVEHAGVDGARFRLGPRLVLWWITSFLTMQMLLEGAGCRGCRGGTEWCYGGSTSRLVARRVGYGLRATGLRETGLSNSCKSVQGAM